MGTPTSARKMPSSDTDCTDLARLAAAALPVGDPFSHVRALLHIGKRLAALHRLVVRGGAPPAIDELVVLFDQQPRVICTILRVDAHEREATAQLLAEQDEFEFAGGD